jgi:hypothetical protein
MSRPAVHPEIPAKNVTGDFDRFKDLTRKLMSVPHSELKARLDAEKEAKRIAKSASHASGVPTKQA